MTPKKFGAMMVGVAVLCGALWLAAWRLSLLPARVYTGADFGIETVRAPKDFDEDGVDDATELLNGARKDAENHPRYDGSYVVGGFPAEEVGVCTDVIWRAFREAGYDLREMIDRDIAAAPEEYAWVETRDKDIDFRRVVNVEKFLQRYGEWLTNDPTEIAEWQPGDMVILTGGTHIGVVSDRRNADGRVYIIHNGGQPVREEDFLQWDEPVGHYRFRGDWVPEEVLAKWGE